MLLYLNKPKPLQPIMTKIINDSILFQLTSSFCFFFIYSIVFLIHQAVLYLEVVFVRTTFYRFYFFFEYTYVFVQSVQVYICMNRQNKHQTFPSYKETNDISI